MGNSVDGKHFIQLQHWARCISNAINLHPQITLNIHFVGLFYAIFVLLYRKTSIYNNNIKRKSISKRNITNNYFHEFYLSFSFLSVLSNQLSPSALLCSEYIGQMLECIPEFIDHYLICVVFIKHTQS